VGPATHVPFGHLEGGVQVRGGDGAGHLDAGVAPPAALASGIDAIGAAVRVLARDVHAAEDGAELDGARLYVDNPSSPLSCRGALSTGRPVLARGEGVDNLAVPLGASTGRDGIGGASVLASAGFSRAARRSVGVRTTS